MTPPPLTHTHKHTHTDAHIIMQHKPSSKLIKSPSHLLLADEAIKFSFTASLTAGMIMKERAGVKTGGGRKE